MAKKTEAKKTEAKKTEITIHEAAQRLADIEVGDFGTLGGNVAPELTEFVLNTSGVDRIQFVELYLSELRIRLLSPEFMVNTRYLKQTKQFNPRS